MSVYLGNQKVSITRNVGEGGLDPETMAELSGAVRWRTNTYNNETVQQMINNLKKEYLINRKMGIDIEYDTPWTRPQDWPDLDSLNLQMEGDDYIYMTYDANQTASAIAWHIDTTNKQPATLDIGHITNGQYIADESYTINHNTNFVRWTDEYSGYLVLRITGQIARCYGYSVTRDGQTQNHRQQPILERIAYVPHLTIFNNGYSTQSWGMWTLEREKIGNGTGTALTSVYYAWAECSRLMDLDITNLHTPNVTTIGYAFGACFRLKELDLRHWYTGKITNFSSLVSDCRSLEEINLTGWDTSKGTSFSNMFNNCRSLKHIYGLEDFDTSLSTTFSSMFNECESMLELPVENFDTTNVVSISSMFTSCVSITKLDLSKWNVNKVTNIGGLFNGCWSLKELNLNNWHTGTLTSIGSCFSNCRSLQSLDISWLQVTSACTNIYAAFFNCYCLKELNIPNNWDVSGLSSGSNTANSLFSGCYSLEKITGISNWNFQLANGLNSMFANCYSLKTLDVSNWNVSTTTSLASIFAYCYSLEELNLSNWTPSNCTNCSGMFSYCYSLKTIGNIDNWDTSKVTTFSSMFSDCWSLKAIPDITKWDFSAATSLASMFITCCSIREVTLNNLTLPQCTTITTMFRYCYSLKKITLTNWSLPKLTATAPAQFLGDCWNLTDVYINIPFALNHSYNGCRSLSHDSVLRILNNLPQVTASRTLNLHSTNLSRLTAAEKAIATNKGWTLAN